MSREVKGRQRTVIRNIRDMAATSTAIAMRVEYIIFYVDPKSVGSLSFLGKERVRFPITDKHSSLIWQCLRKSSRNLPD